MISARATVKTCHPWPPLTTSLTSILSNAFCYKLFLTFQICLNQIFSSMTPNTRLGHMHHVVERCLLVILICHSTGSWIFLMIGKHKVKHHEYLFCPVQYRFSVAIDFALLLNHFLWTAMIEAILMYQQWRGMELGSCPSP